MKDDIVGVGQQSPALPPSSRHGLQLISLQVSTVFQNQYYQ